MARRVPFAAAILSVTLLAVTGCSGSGAAVSAADRTGSAGTSGDSSSSASGDGGSGTNGSSTTGTGGSGTATSGGGGCGNGNGGGGNGNGGGGGGGGNADGFRYTPWGPDDPPIPEQYAAFATAARQDLKCDAVSGVGGEFWDFATKVCQALKSNEGWPDTTSVPSRPTTDNPYEDCLNKELAAMLGRALRWHAANPGRKPVIQYPSRSSTSPCQSRIYDVEVLPPSDPDSSPGKVAISVLAPNGKNGAGFSVTVDGHQRDPDLDDFPSDGLRKAVVLLDTPIQEHDALVVVDNGRGKATTHKHLSAVSGAGSSSGSANPSDSAKPSGSASDTASGNG
jgi:hypothetical protein